MNHSVQDSKAITDLNQAIENPSEWLTNALSVPRIEELIQVSDCNIKVYRWGNPENPPLVLMHGFLAHSHCWAFIAPHLSKDYYVVAFDHTGMGDSGWRDEYNEQVRVRDLMGVCEQFGLFDLDEKPFILAHSYGGRIGTAAVTKYPEKFNGLIICDLMIIRPEVIQANIEMFRPPGGARDPNKPNRVYPDYASARKRFILSPPQDVEVPELADFMAYHSLKAVEGGWQWKFDPRVFAKTQDNEPSWGKIGENVVKAPGRKAIVYGEGSYLFNHDSVDYVYELTEEFKTDRFPIIGIPNARHHLMLDQPMAFLTALRSILSFWRN